MNSPATISAPRSSARAATNDPLLSGRAFAVIALVSLVIGALAFLA